ncbi:MAG: O-antigen ligase family protein, partial [Terriglobales bacterium]
TMVLVILLSCYFHYKQRYWVAGLLLAALVATNLLLNYRGPILGLMVTIALVIPVVPERIGRLRFLPPPGTPRRVIVLVCIALSFGALAGTMVQFVTREGWIDAQAQEKNLGQSQSVAGMLLGGRPEIFVSSQAVMDSPILGHGSWTSDLKYTEMLYDVDFKYDIHTDSLESIEDETGGDIPAHSHIMSSWVQAGILGAVFWFYTLWIALKGLMRVALAQPPLAPYYTWLLVGFVWDVFFSPFGNTRRSLDSLVILFALELVERIPLSGGQNRGFFKGRWKRTPYRENRSTAQDSSSRLAIRIDGLWRG